MKELIEYLKNSSIDHLIKLVIISAISIAIAIQIIGEHMPKHSNTKSKGKS